MATTHAPSTPRRLSPGNVMRRLADAHASGSFSNTRRTRRFEAFAAIVDDVRAQRPGVVRILDIGGTNSFWEKRGWAGREDVEIVLVNLAAEERRHENITPLVGDATGLGEFADESFDIVFSNSVIEHLQSYANQAAMAAEVRRLAPVYWVQTPNFWFPIEPHFLTPAWHWLPVSARVALIRRRRWGWRGPCPDPTEARSAVREIRLMRGSELRRLFPDAILAPEKFGPLVKSFVVRRA